MRLISTLLSAGALFAVNPAMAQQPDQLAPVAEKKICKTITAPASRIKGKRVCRTQAEWNAAGLSPIYGSYLRAIRQPRIS